MPRKTTVQTSIRMARRIWNNISREALIRLREIATQHDFSVGAGDLLYLDNGWYVTHTGLIGLARRKRCSGIHVEAVDSLCDPGANRFVLKATVFPSKGSSGFVGYGDADPSNVSTLVRGAEMRVAELGRSIEPSARPMASASARSRRSGRFRVRLRDFLPKRRMVTATVLAPRSVTASASSSASTSSIRNWSRPMPSTSAAQRRSETPPANKLRTSSSN